MNDLSSGFFAALSEALLASVWQGAVIGVAAAASLHLMRKSTPQARYLVACLALVCCVVLPVLTFVSVFATEDDMRAGVSSAPWIAMTAEGLAPALARIHLRDWVPYLVWSWFVGCSLALARSAVAVAWLQHAMRKPQPVCRRVWQLRIDSLAARMGLARPVRLLLSSDLPSPAVANVVRPVVFLPVAVTTRMPVEWVEALLAHELAHIRRHDYLINLGQKFCEVVLFHQPAVWWLSGRIRHERELIADSMAAESGTDRRTLAAALAELVELQEDEPLLPDLALSARGGRLMARVRSLVRPATPVAVGHAVFPAIALLAVAASLSVDASSGVPVRHALARAKHEMAFPTAGTPVMPVLGTQAGVVLGSGADPATAPVAVVAATPEAIRFAQTRPREAPRLQARLAPLEGLNRKIGETATPMGALGTRTAGLSADRAAFADRRHAQEGTP